MSIALSCEKCGKLYEMPDSLAGKRARCKQCGHEFRIPVPASVARARAAQPARDPYATDQGTVRAKPPADEDDELPPPRAGARPVRSKPRGGRGGLVNQTLLRRGVSFVVFGAGIFLLPLLGLQFRIVSFLGETVQMGIGVVCLAIGAFCIAASGANVVYSVLSFAGMGVGIVVLIVVVGLHQRGEAPRGGARARLAKAARVRPVPKPPMPAPPPAPDLALGPGPGPATSPDPEPEPAATPGPAQPVNEVRVVLSNARVWRDGSFGGRELQFSVDYQFEGGGPRAGGRYVWVIESPGMKATQRPFRLAREGTLTGKVIPFGPNTSTTFETYIAVQTFGFGGRSLQPVSDKLSVAWSGDAAAGPVPGAMPPGAMPGFPPRPGVPTMPRPPFGPRGPRGRFR
jgi:hypothetical protein